MTMVLTRFLALSLFTCSVVGAVTTLTDETWVESVQGKSVFIFFDEPEVRGRRFLWHENSLGEFPGHNPRFGP